MANDERPEWYDDIVATYETIAEQYAIDYFDEPSRKPESWNHGCDCFAQ